MGMSGVAQNAQRPKSGRSKFYRLIPKRKFDQMVSLRILVMNPVAQLFLWFSETSFVASMSHNLDFEICFM
jgi:hypothetical protein